MGIRVLPSLTHGWQEQVADEERKELRTLLLMAVPKVHLRDAFHLAWMMPKRLGSHQDNDVVVMGTRRKMQRKQISQYSMVIIFVREDGTDIVYINFGAMMKSISRDDLTELYRIVMNTYGMAGPEDKLEKGFWKCLRIMFEEPLSTDSIWSEIGQQKIISWRYYDTCRVHCLNLESMDVYMLSDRKYPLSAEVCQTMLKMKLLDGKMNEDCYRLLKMMEKQAGIRK
ncbi:hypothetical protein Tco_0840930 [Tanacetum coccineum]|uniref:Uncharacterized protein n=1 Tax=Tanacetum coccineum TaxID=301880 RepID=A0ABQ5AYU5_9ASTR